MGAAQAGRYGLYALASSMQHVTCSPASDDHATLTTSIASLRTRADQLTELDQSLSVHNVTVRRLLESQTCAHQWERDFNGKCPYGWAGPGQVTWPDYARAQQLGLSVPLQALGGFTYLCIAYSYVLFFVGANALVKLCLLRGTRELNFVLFLAAVLICQELFVKPFMSLPRPEISCLTSCGMPSSHSALAIGTLALYLGDGLLHSTPRQQSTSFLAPGYWSTLRQLDRPTPSKTRWSQMKVFSTKVFLELTSSRFDEPSNRQLVFEGVAWMIFIFPVPLSRVQLGDHTEYQVFVGSMVGILVACFWMKFSGSIQVALLDHLDEKIWCFHHNLTLPCGSALRRLSNGNVPQDTALRVLEYYERTTLERICYLKRYDVLSCKEDDFLKLRWCSLHELILPLKCHETVVEEDTASEGWQDLQRRFRRVAAEGRLRRPRFQRCLSAMQGSQGDSDTANVELALNELREPFRIHGVASKCAQADVA